MKHFKANTNLITALGLACLFTGGYLLSPVLAGIQTVTNPNGSGTTIQVSSANFGDFKYGYQAADHTGWIKLDGRLKSALTSTQQVQATALGIGTNLPSNAGKSVIGVDGTHALGSSAGSSSLTISQANLPNVSLTASLTSAGTPTGVLSAESAGTPVGNLSSGSAGTPTGAIANAGLHNHSATVTFHDSTGGGFNGGRIQSTDRNPTRVQANASEVQIQNAGTHNHGFTGDLLPAHGHSFFGNPLPSHIHGFTGNSMVGHAHSVPLGGSGTPISVETPNLALNGFIYLGV